ncbi:MAG: site-2 protease family protein [Treponema sp.]|nr:site-2 protease family protein [Treponema sp.]MCI6893022.1 site-2 protease family protein [Treponema sp.]
MKWLYGLLCLFFLILFHEFGHFLAAKLFGVKVESFSVGFGPILIHKKIHGTDYRISLFPLGGYCGMKGEKDFQNAIEAKLPQIEGEKDSLYGIHPLKRALIGFAGPFFNFFFAFIAYSLISGIGYKYYTYSNSILINENITSSVAKDAGLESGDIITSINGKVTNDFSDLIQEISVRPDEDLILTVDRNGQNLSFNLHSEMDKATGSGKIGIAADTSKILEKESNKYSFFPALGHGFLESCNSVILTIKSIGLLFKGIDLENAVSGPARVTEMLGTTVKEGFSAGLKQGLIALLSLMAIISISLFIMNLLPIPILDGGLILIAIIEFVFHKKINPKIQYYIQFIGLAFIALLFIIGLQGDIKYFLNKN